jgi:hypothetical protein
VDSLRERIEKAQGKHVLSRWLHRSSVERQLQDVKDGLAEAKDNFKVSPEE